MRQPAVHVGKNAVKGVLDGIGWHWLSPPGWFKHQLVDFNIRRASNVMAAMASVNEPPAGHLSEKLMLLRAIELLAMNAFGQTKLRQYTL